jgi:hypothetical protein
VTDRYGIPDLEAGPKPRSWGVWSLSIPSPGWVYMENMRVMSWPSREEAEEYAMQCREFYVPNRYEVREVP